MVIDLSYDVVSKVLDNWETLRRVHEYEKVAGAMLFKRLFEKCPPTKLLFGFEIGMAVNSDKLLNSKRFLMHATYLIQMLDRSLGMLGPDVELLDDILKDLGKKYARHGVKKEYFHFMGEALRETLKEILKSDFTEEDEHAWVEVYDALSKSMCKEMKKEKVVIKSWNKLKSIDNYEEVVGLILLQSFFEKCPPAKTLFGFPADMDVHSEAMLSSRCFKIHSARFIEMLDVALTMIEEEKLEENTAALSKIYAGCGMKEEYFPLMGEALAQTLRTTLSQDFNSDVEDAWMQVFTKLSTQIVKDMNLAQASKSEKRLGNRMGKVIRSLSSRRLSATRKMATNSRTAS